MLDSVVYTGVTGAGLSRLKALDGLERLDLGAAATVEGVKPLEGCAGLQMLNIYGNTIITDAGLTHLEKPHSLTFLWLVRTRITDDGVAHLKGLVSLQELYLAGTKVTDKGLTSFQGMTELRNLCPFETYVTGKGAVRLRHLPKLDKLELGGKPYQ